MCKNVQGTIEAITTDGFDSLNSVLTIADPSFDQTALRAEEAVVLQAEASWVPGSTATDIIQSINVVIGMIEPLVTAGVIPPMYAAIVVVALNGLKSAILLLEQNSGGAAASEEAALVAQDGWASAPTKFYSSAHAYARDWNRAVGKVPELENAKIKDPWRFLVM